MRRLATVATIALLLAVGAGNSRAAELPRHEISGRIDPEIQEFRSVNNDGGPAVNVPQVFRRIRCFPPQSNPHVTVDPPPFQPPRTGGCW